MENETEVPLSKIELSIIVENLEREVMMYGDSVPVILENLYDRLYRIYKEM